MTKILEIKHVKKSFKKQEVLKDVSLELTSGKIVGFIGKNGAGKTTLMKSIVGLLPIDAGSIRVANQPVIFGTSILANSIGYLPDVPSFYSDMSAQDYLKLCGELAGLSKKETQQRSEELLDLVGLENSNKRLLHYSRGMKQRLGIAQAVFNRPKLLICDEPTSALDPVGRKEVFAIFKKIKQETTVLFSTHILDDVAKLSDEIIFLHEGRTINAQDLAPLTPKNEWLLETSQPLTMSERHLLEKITPVKEIGEAYYLLSGKTTLTQEKLLRGLLAAAVPFKSLQKNEVSLEELFEELIK